MPRSRSLVSRAPARVIYPPSGATPGDALAENSFSVLDVGAQGGGPFDGYKIPGCQWIYADALNALPVFLDAVTPEGVRASITLLPGMRVQRDFRVVYVTRFRFVSQYRAKVFFGLGPCPFEDARGGNDRGGVAFQIQDNVLTNTTTTLTYGVYDATGAESLLQPLRAGLIIDANVSATQSVAAGATARYVGLLQFVRPGYQAINILADVNQSIDVPAALAFNFTAAPLFSFRNVIVPSMVQVDPNAEPNKVDPLQVNIQIFNISPNGVAPASLYNVGGLCMVRIR